jgi:Zn-dependent peptidase ImmA (M78 family)
MMGIREAKMAAQNIINDRWDRKFPVNIVAIVQSMGIELFRYNKPVSLSGAYNPPTDENDWKPRIIINTTENPLRQRFTIAHELGHHVLHGSESFRDPLHMVAVYNQKEIEANEFAANILMPEFQFRHYVESGKYRAMALANLFGVSRVAFSFRMERLGYND